MKYAFICLVWFITNHVLIAQDANIINSDPDVIVKFLKYPFKKMEVEIIQFNGVGANREKAKGKSAFKMLEYTNPNQCLVINKTKNEIMDTTTFNYDRCGGLVNKKGHENYFEYHNRYKNCVLIGRKANETEIFSGGFSHQVNLIRYQYNTYGQISQELIFDFEDSTNTKYSYEYAYKDKLKDTYKEYYFDDDGHKLLNRMSRYFYSNNLLDSMVHYNSENTPIDKMEYTYYSNGKVKSIRNGPDYYEYFYNNELLEKIIEPNVSKEYWIKWIL
jgi:hypothetical protein